MSETVTRYETSNLDRDKLLNNGFQCIYNEKFEEAIGLFDRAIEIEPDLLTCQARALCETFLLADHPNVSQVIKIISNLTEALKLAVECFEITPDTTTNTWTAEKFFKEFISGQAHEETYDSKGQIERLSELGSDLMNLVASKKWNLCPEFRRNGCYFFFNRKRLFGVKTSVRLPRLCIWLSEDVFVAKENDLMSTSEIDCRHETYRNVDGGYARYPAGVEVANIEALLEFTYLYQTSELD